MKKQFRLPMVMAALLVAGMPAGVQAQKLFFLFAHGQYASPVQNNFKSNYNYGAGAEGGAGLGFGKTFVIGTVGYTAFNAAAKSAAGNLTYIPVKIGLRHYILPGNVLFIHADAGMATIKIKGDGSSSRFSGDVGAGVKLGPLEAGVAYNGFSQSDPSGFASWLEFKVGWRMGL